MIDLTSDTATKPTPEMRRFMAEASVGDEQRREDPTVNELQDMVAELTGKEAALFLPSGTMCNIIAYAVHCRPGEAVICDRTAHPNISEGGGPAVIAGVLMRPLNGERGVFTAEQAAAVFHEGDTHRSRTSLISVENTSNMGGGKIWPIERLAELREFANAHGIRMHMDGARLMNAVVASGVAADRWGALVDTVWIDFTKGLGAPIGAVLAGSEAHIARARRLKHAFGGAMRQAGIAAAACLYALDEHIERLASDHANARRLAAGLARIPGIRRPAREPQTNIVFFEPAPGGPSAAQLVERCARRGLGLGAIGPRIRAVTHLDVSAGDIDQALAIIAEAIAEG